MLITCPLETRNSISTRCPKYFHFSIRSDTRQDAFKEPSFNRSRRGNRRKRQPSGNPITDRTTAINASNVSTLGWQRIRRKRRRKSRKSKTKKTCSKACLTFPFSKRTHSTRNNSLYCRRTIQIVLDAVYLEIFHSHIYLFFKFLLDLYTVI